MRNIIVSIFVISILGCINVCDAQDTTPPDIKDIKVSPEKPTTKDEIVISCVVSDDSGVKNVILVYERCSDLICEKSEEIDMKSEGMNYYTAKIGPFSDTLYIVRYYIKATDYNGNSNPAPSKWYEFRISPSHIIIESNISKSVIKVGESVVLTGRCVYDNTLPASNCNLAIFIDDNPISQATGKTDENGYFNITLKEGLYPGERTIRIRAESSDYIFGEKELKITVKGYEDKRIPGFLGILIFISMTALTLHKRLKK